MPSPSGAPPPMPEENAGGSGGRPCIFCRTKHKCVPTRMYPAAPTSAIFQVVGIERGCKKRLSIRCTASPHPKVTAATGKAEVAAAAAAAQGAAVCATAIWLVLQPGCGAGIMTTCQERVNALQIRNTVHRLRGDSAAVRQCIAGRIKHGRRTAAGRVAIHLPLLHRLLLLLLHELRLVPLQAGLMVQAALRLTLRLAHSLTTLLRAQTRCSIVSPAAGG